MPPVNRRYHSPLRAEQATNTRQRIACAAAAEFSARGWAGTTVAAIAARAQVTPQAVHLAVGGKAALLIRGVEVAVAGAPDDQLLADRSAFAALYAPGVSAGRRLAAFGAVTCDVYQRAARLFLVLQEAAASDPAAASMAEEAGARRLADHRRLAGLLLPDAEAEERDTLADTIWVLAGPGVYVDFVHRRGWDPRRYARWLVEHLRHALGAGGTAAGGDLGDGAPA